MATSRHWNDRQMRRISIVNDWLGVDPEFTNGKDSVCRLRNREVCCTSASCNCRRFWPVDVPS
ncbi:MAG: hypothetical protein R3C05_12160 [Pirellulaceae bacterium]